MTELAELIQQLSVKVDNLNIIQSKHGLSDKKWLSFDELALYLDVSIETVYALNKRKELTIYGRNSKLKYYKREEVDAWIELGGALRLSKYELSKKIRKAA